MLFHESLILLNTFMKYPIPGVKNFTNNNDYILKNVIENLQCNYKSQ